MANSDEILETPTKIFIEGGNNADRIGGSSTVIFHQDEKGKTTRVMYDCGALFAPENVDLDSFVADVLKYLTIDDESLKKAFPDKSQAEINKIRETYKEHGIGSKKLDAMFVTHMHEDHIGGLVNLLKAGVKFPKIYASKSTIGIIERLCQNAGIVNMPELQEVSPYQTVKVNDSFEVSAIPVSHSTAGAYAFYTKTSYNDEETGILNMGDYNIGLHKNEEGEDVCEETPIGEGFNEEKFEDFMKGKPINNILVDSTSATLGSIVSDNPTSHKEAVKNIVEVCNQYKNKMVVTPIISRSTENLYNFLEAAKQSGRKVFLDGYMLRHTYDVLQSQGLMDAYKDVVFHSSDTVNADAKAYLQQVPPEERMVIFSGAFAEGETLGDGVVTSEQKPSGFVKFVNGLHKDFPKELLAESVVIAAQRMIPVGSVPQRQKSMYAKAQQAGAVVIQNETDEEHSLGAYLMKRFQRSGHASGKELHFLLKLCYRVRGNKDATMFVSPVHGDSHQLGETAKVVLELAKTAKKIKRYTPLNGDIIHVAKNYTKAKKRLKDLGQFIYKWIGFKDISQYGEVAYTEMYDCEEKISEGGKVVYTKSERPIVTMVAGVGKVDKRSYSSAFSEEEKRQRVEDFYEDKAMHESMRKMGPKGYKKSGKGGR